MRMNLLVNYADGKTQEVTASATDLVKFEREFDMSISKLGVDMKFTHLLFLAHSSLFRQGETKLDFDAWLDSVESVGASEKDPK
jgi:hypothetical protein